MKMPAAVLPMIVFGQDEAISNPFLGWWKAWSGPFGSKALWPKDDGLTTMISTIVELLLAHSK